MPLETLPMQLCKPQAGTTFSRKVQGQKRIETLLGRYLRLPMFQAQGLGPSILLLPLPHSHIPNRTWILATLGQAFHQEVLGRFTTQHLRRQLTCSLVFRTTISLQVARVGELLRSGTSWLPVEGDSD